MEEQALKNDKWMLFILLPTILLLCYFMWHLKADMSGEVVVRSDTPVFDLRGADIDGSRIKLSGGNTEFVPEALLTPEAFAARTDIQIGSPNQVAEYYTARFRILVPDGRTYAISLRSIDYADRIYINGMLMQSMGQPGPDAANKVPKTAMMYFTVQPVDGVIEVLRQVSNFVHKEYGRPPGYFIIGSVDNVSRFHNRHILSTAIIAGAYLLLFIVHLVLFALQKSYRANLYFALFCFVWMLRTAVVGPKLLTLLFPGLSWYAAFRAEYMAIPIAAMLIALALNAMFTGLLQKWAKRAIVAVNAAAALLFLFAPTVFMSRALPFVYATTLLCAAYVSIRFLMELRARRGVRQIIILCALVVFVYLVIHEMLRHSNILIFPMVQMSMMDFAALVFVLFQMVAAFHGTMQEVAAAREAEQRLARENEALDRINRLKSDIIETISHETRTPLAVLASYAGLVSMELKDKGTDAQTAADLDTIIFEAKHIADLIDRLREFSGKEAITTKRSVLDMGDLIHNMARLYQHILERGGVQLVIDVPDDLPPVFGSPEELTQVLFNLMQNAKRHTESGSVKVAAFIKDGFITVTVSDTGSGIAPELLPRVFERGVSGRADGTGLGLTICKDAVESHGGEIVVDSTQGEGTAVTFTLPEYKV